MAVVRLRIELADTPGSLAEVAAFLGAYDGNIVGIDVLPGEEGKVVDEITIELPDAVDLGELRRILPIRCDARVLSYLLASPVDPLSRVLRRLAEAMDATADPELQLRRAVAELCSTPAVWLMSPVDASAYEAGRAALRQPGAAVVLRTKEKLPALGETIRGEAALLAITTGEALPVLLVGRSVEQGFTPTEASRVEALAALFAKLMSVSVRA